MTYLNKKGFEINLKQTSLTYVWYNETLGLQGVERPGTEGSGTNEL